MKKTARLFLVFSLLTLFTASGVLADDAQTEAQKAQAQRHQIRQETDNKIREMANETYVNGTTTSDEQQESLFETVLEYLGF